MFRLEEIDPFWRNIKEFNNFLAEQLLEKKLKLQLLEKKLKLEKELSYFFNLERFPKLKLPLERYLSAIFDPKNYNINIISKEIEVCYNLTDKLCNVLSSQEHTPYSYGFLLIGASEILRAYDSIYEKEKIGNFIINKIIPYSSKQGYLDMTIFLLLSKEVSGLRVDVDILDEIIIEEEFGRKSLKIVGMPYHLDSFYTLQPKLIIP